MQELLGFNLFFKKISLFISNFFPLYFFLWEFSFENESDNVLPFAILVLGDFGRGVIPIGSTYGSKIFTTIMSKILLIRHPLLLCKLKR